MGDPCMVTGMRQSSANLGAVCVAREDTGQKRSPAQPGDGMGTRATMRTGVANSWVKFCVNLETDDCDCDP